MKTNAPDISIPKQHVTGVSKEQVQVSTWAPNDGFARSREIEAEREKAMAEYRERMTREDPILGRFIRLEEEVADLKLEIQFLKKELKSTK